jgi:DNA-binding MarR family transcriptional regulator
VAAWSALAFAHRRIAGLLDTALRDAVDMGLDEYETLNALRRSRRALPMSELADRVPVSRAALTRLADGLVAREWVERWYDDQDRRRVLVELTDDGWEAHAEAADVYLAALARLVQRPLRDHDLEAFADALDALADAAQASAHSSQRT